MGEIGRCCVAGVALLVLSVTGCATGKDEARREQQQALVRELTAKCDEGQQQDCTKAAEEKRILFDVYGCHCKDSPPPEHKAVWSGG